MIHHRVHRVSQGKSKKDKNKPLIYRYLKDNFLPRVTLWNDQKIGRAVVSWLLSLLQEPFFEWIPGLRPE